ncbi:hypothetical protein [Pseudoalteromonas sp. S558]|uniref:hypothetical protein n=1 Tax=Pseudoalteromonas sp. S558 TaxID=2066515 RepID=UPI00110A15C0|nr:hypothetical protein [Pseudoalteromonas sp. S558]TMN99191.1 hypothetical protein CWB66_16105 [Pseudoalteromonas sp. S558]
MNILSPNVAAQLAEFAYDSIAAVSKSSSNIEPSRIISKHFVFDSKKSAFTGISGTVAEHVLNHATGFGFFGKNKLDTHPNFCCLAN